MYSLKDNASTVYESSPSQLSQNTDFHLDFLERIGEEIEASPVTSK